MLLHLLLDDGHWQALTLHELGGMVDLLLQLRLDLGRLWLAKRHDHGEGRRERVRLLVMTAGLLYDCEDWRARRLLLLVLLAEQGRR